MYLQSILKDDRDVLDKSDVQMHAKFPKFAEITVANLYKIAESDPGLLRYLPPYESRKLRTRPERDFVWKIFASLRPHFCRRIVADA